MVNYSFMIVKILSGLVAFLGSLVVFLIPYFKHENEKLQKENDQKNNLIKSIKNAEEIKVKNSKLSKSDLIRGLSNKD